MAIREIKNVEVENKKVVGVANEDKIALYNILGQFIANETGETVQKVKPTAIKEKVVVDGKEKNKSKKVGFYGLCFAYEGQTFSLELVVKDASFDPSVLGVELEYDPDPVDGDENTDENA